MSNFVDISLIVSNNSSLLVSKADHHPFFITLFAGHQVFNSIPAIFFQYFCWISRAVFISFWIFHPNICIIIGFSKSV